MNADMILTTALVNQLQCAQVSDESLEERECNVMFNDNHLGNPRWGYAWGVHKLPHA